MEFAVRRIVSFIDEETVAARQEARPLRKVAVAAVVGNFFAGRYVEDLTPMIEASLAVGRRIAGQAASLMAPYAIESYAKGAIVGTGGEVEHAEAVLTTAFGDTLREAAGGGKAWISHCAKRGPAGCPIDIPLAHKDALFVRSHYDVLTLCVPDAPLPDEILIFACFANRGRLAHRIGGLAVSEISGADGLR